MNIYINIEDYLAQWFVNEQGGCVPVRLTRGSIESKILELYLIRCPDDVKPDCGGEGKLAIVIPCFRFRPPEIYNYLPLRAEKALVNIIRERFDVALFKDLHAFGNITKQQKDLIYAWMENHGIEITETNWCTIDKRYQRLRNLYLKRQRSKEDYQRKKTL